MMGLNSGSSEDVNVQSMLQNVVNMVKPGEDQMTVKDLDKFPDLKSDGISSPIPGTTILKEGKYAKKKVVMDIATQYETDKPYISWVRDHITPTSSLEMQKFRGLHPFPRPSEESTSDGEQSHAGTHARGDVHPNGRPPSRRAQCAKDYEDQAKCSNGERHGGGCMEHGFPDASEKHGAALGACDQRNEGESRSGRGSDESTSRGTWTRRTLAKFMMNMGQ